MESVNFNIHQNVKDLKEEELYNYRMFILALQHIFAMFGATILVPMLTGLPPSVALFTSGLGTLVFHLTTRGKVPAYLGSSFAFIAPIIAAKADFGTGGALAGIVVAGLIYGLTAILIKTIGVKFFKKLLPPIVVGPVIITIGLGLATTAKDMAVENLPLALITLGTALVFSVFGKGVFKIVPVLIGMVTGYIVALLTGFVDTSVIASAPWFSVPNFTLPVFTGNWGAVALIAPLALVTMTEHLGDVTALGNTVGKDYIKKPGLHRTLLGDGLATAMAGFLGGPPNTTYGENVGVLAITKIYNPIIIQLAAAMVVVLSFCGKVSAVIRSIPVPVMGGISILLYGMIAMVGVRTLIESKVDITKNRNLVIASTIVVIGVSGLAIPVFGLTFAGMGAGALIGIVLNIVFRR